MIIRDYRDDDFDGVVALWKETGIYNVERGDTSEVIGRCNRMGGKFLVMEEQGSGHLAGTSWMSYDGRRLHLHHFAIRPDLQRKGLGKKLAIESLRFASHNGWPVKLEVHRNNTPAIRLYKSLGFHEFGDYDVFMILDPRAVPEL